MANISQFPTAPTIPKKPSFEESGEVSSVMNYTLCQPHRKSKQYEHKLNNNLCYVPSNHSPIKISKYIQAPPPHVPNFLPQFPPRHTYIHTPVYPTQTDGPRERAIRAHDAKRAAEDVLVRLGQGIFICRSCIGLNLCLNTTLEVH